MYWLVPVYLFNNKFRAYLFGLIAMLTFFSLFIGLVAYLMRDLQIRYAPLQLFDPKPAMYFAFALVFVGASSAIKFFQRWIVDTRAIAELTAMNMRAELEQLKNQVNPHFLFNMLNNANVLLDSDPKKASQVLMSLSDLVRYQLYDSARSAVFLHADIRFLEDCLALEHIRRDHFDFSVTTSGVVQGVMIPPFLFISFVENAIKHSLDPVQKSFVKLHVELIDKQLTFTCLNSKPQQGMPKTELGGIGLANIKRRLEFLFAHQHQLIIDDQPITYSVKLILNL